ncbi:hypothetical protein GJ496_001102 [Pomphorhynchus laevis]|nr:hypothetical protein GJ496_001102 [Pomphorhynchus laevis]
MILHFTFLPIVVKSFLCSNCSNTDNPCLSFYEDPILRISPINSFNRLFPYTGSCNIDQLNAVPINHNSYNKVKLKLDEIKELGIRHWLRKPIFHSFSLPQLIQSRTHIFSNMSIRYEQYINDWIQYAYISVVNIKPVMYIEFQEKKSLKLKCGQRSTTENQMNM